uniref:RNA-directed DNA polymerase n=1 Tax=Photinus pyralis TaxID=7054 RepID=A0A1Y1K6Q2_PHOPY
MSQAYQQIEVDEESKQLLTISTHKGLYECNRLAYGVASAPGLFQREMEKLMQGLDNVTVFLDDILVTGPTNLIHLQNLNQVLNRIKNAGLTLNKAKCQFFQKEIAYLGHIISRVGLQMDQRKIKAIIDAPLPENLMQLRAWLGLINYYSKFLPNAAARLKPLYEMLQKDEKFEWNNERRKCIDHIKEIVTSNQILAHFNPNLKLKLTCDASPYGLGCVLSHILGNGDEKPIAFASRSLSKAERDYSQIDKEATAIIFGIKRFHQYLYGNRFTLLTDHKALVSIFGEKKGIPVMAASRLQRYAVILAGYNFEVKYTTSKDNTVADCLSRTPLVESERNECHNYDFSFLNIILESIPITEKEIKSQIQKDIHLRRVYNYVTSDWPEIIDDELKPYFIRRHEIFVENEILMWGHRVIIPKELRNKLLLELHSEHFGVVKMKQLARSYMWWPKCDRDIENITKTCEICLIHKDNPPKSELHQWDYPQRPNQRLHIDFCELNGINFLVIVDGYSKWLEFEIMKHIKTPTAVDALRKYFANWGLPHKIVSDNGPTFCSKDFESFVKYNGIVHIKTAPYHAASNGAAENSVRTFKNCLKKLIAENIPLKQAVSRILLAYRSNVHITRNKTPAELQIGRKLRIRLDQIKPNSRNVTESRREKQKLFFRGNRRLNLNINDVVMVKDYRGNNWVKGKVINKLSPVTYLIETVDDKLVWKRHLDQIIKCNIDDKDSICSREREFSPNLSEFDIPSNNNPSSNDESTNVTDEPTIVPDQSSVNDNSNECSLRRSSRIRKPRNILDL